MEPGGRVLLALELEQDDDTKITLGVGAFSDGGEGGAQADSLAAPSTDMDAGEARRLPPSLPVDVMTRPVESLTPAEVGNMLDALELGRYREELESTGRDGAWLASCCAGAEAEADTDADEDAAGSTALRDAGVCFGAHRAKLRRAVAVMMQQGGVPRSMVERDGGGGNGERSSFFGSFF